MRRLLSTGVLPEGSNTTGKTQSIRSACSYSVSHLWINTVFYESLFVSTKVIMNDNPVLFTEIVLLLKTFLKMFICTKYLLILNRTGSRTVPQAKRTCNVLTSSSVVPLISSILIGVPLLGLMRLDMKGENGTLELQCERDSDHVGRD
ncbi:hypothetical protein PHYBLDRAFT_165044 [Phycomyces blakesleeanus NRRL 1555(-)]|uniref:Uncharacterized protein n=1 Tax=Phycomyces blakesleeanus (strain ATCC 8743b / DSM 1359 / FGSC 10004 / NBRC 33097 / NRRL 1555) TaxID=763407 RepID=A0A167NRJ9_PHYB8|nr:hypothetical protein PHYBLDRAFT_165044 [Phycomyces blakesleeanus NRRL 1555(-)]OAD76518.1 hypothetical protein PHYBLDRAFT_165044 [Phycomyces blakesleeanus NRRL 1555(-)]|eukprot:XP_018294558.1 hypothetical protein PHYBLDRAFT_165044 [Phycomyces blakesleeanus NRRL 1555(-)]